MEAASVPGTLSPARPAVHTQGSRATRSGECSSRRAGGGQPRLRHWRLQGSSHSVAEERTDARCVLPRQRNNFETTSTVGSCSRSPRDDNGLRLLDSPNASGFTRGRTDDDFRPHSPWSYALRGLFSFEAGEERLEFKPEQPNGSQPDRASRERSRGVITSSCGSPWLSAQLE